MTLTPDDIDRAEGRALLLIARRKAFTLHRAMTAAKKAKQAHTGLYAKWVRANAEVLQMEARYG